MRKSLPILAATAFLSVSGPATGQTMGQTTAPSTGQESTKTLQFPLTSATGARTVVNCTRLNADDTIGPAFLRALDMGFHKEFPGYRPALDETALRAHLALEGIKPTHLDFMRDECMRRLGLD